MDDRMIIGKHEYPVKEIELFQKDLKFYPENPRVYSLLNLNDSEPSQEDIEDQLCNMEHVKQLRVSIEANGGLIDPLVVRDGDFVVLEGNSRLAAYRLLNKKNTALMWCKVKCKVLPSDIPQSAIFHLLGQYHIIGRKDWNPYEQAGYIFRTTRITNISIDVLADELGISKDKAKKSVEIYKFMQDHDDLTPQHWSYWAEYYKSRSIKRLRDEYLNLDDIVVDQVKSGKIVNAIDIRYKLEPLAKTTGKKASKIIKSFINGDNSLDDCFDELQSTGRTGNIYQFLSKFRTKIKDNETKQILDNLSSEEKTQCIFELKRINKELDRIIKKLVETNNQL